MDTLEIVNIGLEALDTNSWVLVKLTEDPQWAHEPDEIAGELVEVDDEVITLAQQQPVFPGLSLVMYARVPIAEIEDMEILDMPTPE